MKGKAPFVLTASSGKLKNRKDGTWLTLENGQRYAGIVGQHQFDNAHFDRYEVHLTNRQMAR